MTERKTEGPVVLIVRDGWGANPFAQWDHANAIHLARTPVDDRLMRDYPHVLINTSGEDVGLPDKVMGNSEVGHQNIGAGRIVEQEIMRITGRIRDGSFFENEGLRSAFERAQRTGGRVHLMGLCSDGRVHSDLEHLYALIAMAGRVGFPASRVFVHAFTDGRDTVPTHGIKFIEAIERQCRDRGVNPVASVIGRFYAMDRDNRWGRVEQAYRLLTEGRGAPFSSATDAIAHYYGHPSEPALAGDEFVAASATVRDGKPIGTVRDGDSVIFFNFRGDRPRELTKAFTSERFPFPAPDDSETSLGFARKQRLDLTFVTMTAYERGLAVAVAFEKPAKMNHIYGGYLAGLGLKQFRCAETEKYPHVTFFFNDYRDEPFDGETWKIIPSPRDVSTYDQKPEMSAAAVTDAVLARLETSDDDAIVINFANGDMVGHTGVIPAAIQAVETVDACVGRVMEAVLAKRGKLIITADHGNAEQMINPETGGPHTAHTTYPVELVVVDNEHRGQSLREGGRLADIAPTALDLMGVDIPAEMSGVSLLLR